MPQIKQFVDAAGGNFDGTAGKGLILSSEAIGIDDRYHFCITNLCYTGAAGTVVTSLILLSKNQAGGANALDECHIRTFSLVGIDPPVVVRECCCFCIVPSHNLLISTVGKTGDGFLIVDYDLRVPL